MVVALNGDCYRSTGLILLQICWLIEVNIKYFGLNSNKLTVTYCLALCGLCTCYWVDKNSPPPLKNKQTNKQTNKWKQRIYPLLLSDSIVHPFFHLEAVCAFIYYRILRSLFQVTMLTFLLIKILIKGYSSYRYLLRTTETQETITPSAK